jgi:hypothetical protein
VKNDNVFNYLSAQIRKDSMLYQKVIRTKKEIDDPKGFVYPKNEIKNVMIKFHIYEIRWRSYGIEFRLSSLSNNACYNSWYEIRNEPHNLKDTMTYSYYRQVNGPNRFYVAESY